MHSLALEQNILYIHIYIPKSPSPFCTPRGLSLRRPSCSGSAAPCIQANPEWFRALHDRPWMLDGESSPTDRPSGAEPHSASKPECMQDEIQHDAPPFHCDWRQKLDKLCLDYGRRDGVGSAPNWADMVIDTTGPSHAPRFKATLMLFGVQRSFTSSVQQRKTFAVQSVSRRAFDFMSSLSVSRTSSPEVLFTDDQPMSSFHLQSADTSDPRSVSPSTDVRISPLVQLNNLCVLNGWDHYFGNSATSTSLTVSVLVPTDVLNQSFVQASSFQFYAASSGEAPVRFRGCSGLHARAASEALSFFASVLPADGCSPTSVELLMSHLRKLCILPLFTKGSSSQVEVHDHLLWAEKLVR